MCLYVTPKSAHLKRGNILFRCFYIFRPHLLHLPEDFHSRIENSLKSNRLQKQSVLSYNIPTFPPPLPRGPYTSFGVHGSFLTGHRDHTVWTHHSGPVINPAQRPLRDKTQHSQETDVHAVGDIRTRSLRKRGRRPTPEIAQPPGSASV